MSKKILGRNVRCSACQAEHEIYGAPGQEVTAKIKCPCGVVVVATTTFPAEV